MNFLYAGDFSTDWSTETYVADLLRGLGHPVAKAHLPKETRESVMRIVETTPPGIFLFCKLHLRGLETPGAAGSFLRKVRERGWKTACWVFDLFRAEFSPERYAWASAVSKECDRFFTTDGGMVNDPNVPNAILLRQGYPGPVDSTDRGNIKQGYRCRIAHLGGRYGQRKQWVEKMEQEFRARRFLSFNKVRGNDLFNLCKSANVIAAPPWPSYPHYWSNRLYIVTGYGGCFAGREVPGMAEEGWVADEHYIKLPEDPSKALQVLRLVSHDIGWYDRVRRTGQKFCFQNHTLRHRTEDLVRHLEQL